MKKSEKDEAKEKMRGFIDEMISERVHQTEKWGDNPHQPLLWLAVLGEEFGEVSHEILNTKTLSGLKRLKDELVDLATVCAAFYEDVKRMERNP